LGCYEITAPIGAGGMGEVWKARDTRLDRIVAVKISKEQFSERFEREARAVAALNHPHICTLHDVGLNYLVMEYIEGQPLKGPLPPAQAVEYAGQILDALDAAHRKGITHRDLKPANVLVTKQGIKLLDFGLAKQAGLAGAAADATLTQALTAQGQIVGTLQYMAPEQLQGKEADARSDLFAFGCVLYEMVTGGRAFEGESAASVISAVMEREPVPLTGVPALERVVRRCLAKDPDQRFQNRGRFEDSHDVGNGADARNGRRQTQPALGMDRGGSGDRRDWRLGRLALPPGTPRGPSIPSPNRSPRWLPNEFGSQHRRLRLVSRRADRRVCRLGQRQERPVDQPTGWLGDATDPRHRGSRPSFLVAGQQIAGVLHQW
jgi:serine/threonine protein kinase